MKKEKTVYTINLIISMFIFGTIGLLRKNISMPSGCLAMTRGIAGGVFLLLFKLIKDHRLSLNFPGKKKALLIISGILVGFNWIALFEAYRFTTVATATLCYYMAPVIVILASPFLFREKLGLRKIICVLIAIVGMVLVSGVLNPGEEFTGSRGIILGLAAATMYAIIIICNKYLSEIPPYEKTIVQLSSAGIILIPYTLVVEDLSIVKFDMVNIMCLILICLLATGLSYILYFGAISKLSAQTGAILSYIDPVVAVFVSAFILKENVGPAGFIGAVLIIGAMILSEVELKKSSLNN